MQRFGPVLNSERSVMLSRNAAPGLLVLLLASPALAQGPNCHLTSPLECSAPWKAAIDPTLALYDEVFDPACRQHDWCYRYGNSTYGITRTSCDDSFYEEMKEICNDVDLVDLLTLGVSWADCRKAAFIFYRGVQNGGNPHFHRNNPCCDYKGTQPNCPRPGESSAAVSSRFNPMRGDVDRNGRTDIVFAGQGWSGAGLNVRVKVSGLGPLAALISRRMTRSATPSLGPLGTPLQVGSWTSWSEVLGDGPGVHRYPTLTGDVDGDGRMDLIFVGQGWSGAGLNVRVKRSKGDGTWTSWSEVLGDGPGVHSHATLTGDVDGDGKTDLIFVGQGWSGAGLNVRVKRSKGDGTWTSWSEVLGDGPGVHSHATLTGDVDADRKTDLIFVGQGWSGAGLNVRVKRSKGDGTWTSWSEVLGDGPGVHSHPTLTGDVDGDGKTDLILIGMNWSGPGLNVRVKRSNGDGTWLPAHKIFPDGPALLR